MVDSKRVRLVLLKWSFTRFGSINPGIAILKKGKSSFMKTFAFRFVGFTVALLAATGLMTGTAVAQNDGNISVGAGIDFVSDYYFRGIVQETGGVVAQPWLEAGIAVNDNFSFAVGTWNSLHSVQAEGETVPSWYESDFYAGLSGATGSTAIDVTYTKYMSPRGSWGSVKELAIGVGYDTFIAPYATIAIEMDSGGGADGGSNDGTYFELGVEPGLPLDTDTYSVSIPIALGLSLSDYYEGGTSDSSFGFFSLGASLGIPLAGVPAEFGSWEFAGSLSLLVFGDGLKAINDSDDGAKVIALFGLSMGY